ncbi:hypothetical protein FB451DRAFT_1436854 [Mycena latifolia]|nr:hypothetical protein FB451DRAFT_1436854 [Mycena latifolia]
MCRIARRMMQLAEISAYTNPIKSTILQTTSNYRSTPPRDPIYIQSHHIFNSSPSPPPFSEHLSERTIYDFPLKPTFFGSFERFPGSTRRTFPQIHGCEVLGIFRMHIKNDQMETTRRCAPFRGRFLPGCRKLQSQLGVPRNKPRNAQALERAGSEGRDSVARVRVHRTDSTPSPRVAGRARARRGPASLNTQPASYSYQGLVRCIRRVVEPLRAPRNAQAVGRAGSEGRDSVRSILCGVWT